MALLGARTITFVAGGALGAAVAYFFDPDRGKLRRHRSRSQVAARFRRGTRRVERVGRYAGSTAAGKYQAVAARSGRDLNIDDQTLAHKVESELFGDKDIPKGTINVNAEDGVVVIRGEVGTPGMIEDIERRIRRIAGVVGVENLLHLPGIPAPNKREALRASRPGGSPTA